MESEKLMIPAFKFQDPDDEEWPDDDVADPDEEEEGYPNRLPFPWAGTIGGLT